MKVDLEDFYAIWRVEINGELEGLSAIIQNDSKITLVTDGTETRIIDANEIGNRKAAEETQEFLDDFRSEDAIETIEAFIEGFFV